MKVVVIVPTYNEKDNIERLIKQIFKISRRVKNHEIHILIVDDNSPDGTGEIVQGLQKKYPRLHMISGKKEGLGRAYMRGMKHASTKLEAEVMFEHDADFSHDPNEIPNFLKKIDEGYDLVIGSRYIPGGSIPANWGIHRIIYSVLGNWVVRAFLFHFEHHDWTTGYRAIRTPLYKKVAKDLEAFKGYTFQVSFLHKAFLKGARVAEIPIQFKDRVHGQSKIGSAEYIFNLMKYLVSATIENPPRQLRFIVVGGSSFLLQSTMFALLKDLIGPEIANAVGFTLAVTNNFFMNNFWTFSDRSKQFTPRLILSYAKFFTFSLLALSIQTISIVSTQFVLGQNDFSEWVGFMIGVILGLFVNYLVYSRVIWREKK